MRETAQETVPETTTQATTETQPDVLTCGEVDPAALEDLLARFGLRLHRVADGAKIPGSYWGEPEAGLRQLDVFIRADTPVHSLLHEAGHTICADAARRAELDTEAGGDDAEENGVCYLQILLADHLPGVGSARLMEDMDRWGYSFRLGSTRAWFEEDAEDACRWLKDQGLIDRDGRILWRLRNSAPLPDSSPAGSDSAGSDPAESCHGPIVSRPEGTT